MEPIIAAFMHFYYLDLANAQIHIADVKFSPVTFGLADWLADEFLRPDAAEAMNHVITHKGRYEVDKGR